MTSIFGRGLVTNSLNASGPDCWYDSKLLIFCWSSSSHFHSAHWMLRLHHYIVENNAFFSAPQFEFHVVWILPFVVRPQHLFRISEYTCLQLFMNNGIDFLLTFLFFSDLCSSPSDKPPRWGRDGPECSALAWWPACSRKAPPSSESLAVDQGRDGTDQKSFARTQQSRPSPWTRLNTCHCQSLDDCTSGNSEG